MEKRYLTWKQAKEYTGMGDSTLTNMLADVGIHVFQPEGYGTARFVDKADIDKAFKQSKKRYGWWKLK